MSQRQSPQDSASCDDATYVGFLAQWNAIRAHPQLVLIEGVRGVGQPMSNGSAPRALLGRREAVAAEVSLIYGSATAGPAVGVSVPLAEVLQASIIKVNRGLLHAQSAILGVCLVAPAVS